MKNLINETLKEYKKETQTKCSYESYTLVGGNFQMDYENEDFRIFFDRLKS